MIDKLIKDFNNLNGKTVRRTKLEKLSNKAFDTIYENEIVAGEILRRLSKILRVNKSEKSFLIEIKNKVRKTNQPTKKELLGMNKPFTSLDISKMITDKIETEINRIKKLISNRETSKQPNQLRLNKPSTKLFIEEKNTVLEPVITPSIKEQVTIKKPISIPVALAPEKTPKPVGNKSKSLKGLRSIGANIEKAPLWNIPGETGKFLQSIERKPKESVAIVLSTPAGTGKTTAVYKWMNDISPKENTLFLSLEEHPDSNLATDKRDKYLSTEAQQNINTAGSIPSKTTLFEWIEAHEVIVIDSWQKLVKLIGNIDFDTELRKKFDGKLFIIIFQQTVDGKAKGGSDKVFDGDVIIEGKKGSGFSENYLFFDKNRYATKDLNETYYNIATHKVYNPKTISNQPKQTTTLEV